MPGPDRENPERIRENRTGAAADVSKLLRSASRLGVPLGQIVATPNALSQIPSEEVLHGLQRHRTQDWGIVDPSDRAANDQALQEGTRILSAYRASNGITFWIITEADRSVTTILLPEDY